MLWSAASFALAAALISPASLVQAHPAADAVFEDNGNARATITAAPQLPDLAARTALGTTDPWVSVDDEGRPAATLTPFLTTDNEGSTYLRDAAPHDLTATVFTTTYYGKVSTSTGDPPNPSATHKDSSEGGFPVCSNMDGDNAPLCAPRPSSTLYKDSVYYITWDPEYYNKTTPSSNTTMEISVRLDYFNRTAENSDEGEIVKLDETDRVPASWGVFALKIKGEHLKGYRPHNVTITLMANEKGSAAKNESAVVNVLLDQWRNPGQELSDGPDHDDLVIALPVVFGSIVLIAVGLCLWNRKTRRIQLGNIMSRAAHGRGLGGSGAGYTGRSARNLMNRNGRKDDVGIALEPTRTGGYRDDEHHSDPNPYYGRPRGDSDLGSLAAASPTTAGFGQAATYGGENAFREELRRQDNLRRNER